MTERAATTAVDTAVMVPLDGAATAAAGGLGRPTLGQNGAVAPNRSASADAAALGVAAVWGSTYASMKVVGASLSVPSFLATRFMLGAFVLTLVALRLPGRVSRTEVRLGVEFGCLLFVILALETYGVQHTTATNAGFLIGISVLAVPLVERIALGRRSPVAIYLYMVLALFGLGLLTLQHGLTVQTGNLIVAAAALVRAVQIVAFGRRAEGVAISLIRVTAIALWVVGAVGAAAALVYPMHALNEIAALSAGNWALLIYLGLCATAAAFLAQLYATRVSSPVRVGMIMSTEPVFAAACGLLLLGERIGPLQWLGGFLVVVAIIGARRCDARSRGQVSGELPA